MNLKQIRTLCKIADNGLRLSDTAKALHISQPSITRQIQELERELGINIFLRSSNRILDITTEGRVILSIARRLLKESENLQRAGEELAQPELGQLSVATTNTQARYTLPRVIQQFKKDYPKVRLALRLGTPVLCCEMVARGRVDIAICSEVDDLPPDLVEIPCYWLSRSVITPPRHPLLRVKPLTVEAIARYPIITYDESFSGRRIVNKAFADKGLDPIVALSTIDADVKKAYVELGLGIAILASVTFNPKRDTRLRRLDAKHLFESSKLSVVVRKNSYLRSHTLDFIKLFAPKLKRSEIETAPYGAAFPDRAQLPEL